MNATAVASLAAGGTAAATVTVPNTHMCEVPGAVLYGTASSFVEPTADNKTALANVLTRLALGGPMNQLLISGHTDLAGDAGRNRLLSERRTRGAQAVLADDPATWETITATEHWAAPEFGQMVVEVGDADPADPVAVAAAVAAVTGPAHQAVRTSLFHRYFARLLGGRAVPPITAASPATLGCGQNQPLRGNPAAPSRDPALPPITGDYRPNRRVEFYFADGGAGPLTCAAYPTWTAACALAPPPPAITVAFAPLATVRNGGTADLQVTIGPSPLPSGFSVTLTVATRSGVGAAVFDAGGKSTTTVTASGPVRLRGTAPSSEADNVEVTAAVTGRSAVVAREAFTVAAAVTVFARFEVFNLGTRAFVPLPAGVEVDLMDQDPVRDDRIATARTDAGGNIFLNVDAAGPSGEDKPDLFLLVHTNGRTHAGHTLPESWSTAGWKATDGSPGLRDDFPGGAIGAAGSPVVFRVGVDYHARLVYPKGPTTKSAPARIPIDVHSGRVGRPASVSTVTDHDGEVHGVVFDIEPGRDFWFHIEFVMTDSAVNLPRARVHMSQLGWSTIWDDADTRVRLSLAETSVGSAATPWELRATENDRDAALSMLTVLREWSTVLFRLTGGAWAGVSGLTLFRTSLSGTAYSWPVGEVNIPPSDHFNRGTLSHELSHQIMWQEVNFSSLGIGYQAIFGNLQTYHIENLLANPQHALIEGWAEFVEAVFAGPATPPPYSVGTLQDDDGKPVPLGPPPADRGESVEGAFANGLWAVFENEVVTPAVAADAHVPESANGDVMTTAAATFLSNTGVRDRFLSMIWRPLQDLRPRSSPTTTDMFTAMRARNPARWHAILPRLQAFNMMMTVPTVTAVAPVGGPPAGGNTVTVTGDSFTLGRTTVRFGANPAAGVTVTSATSLTAVVPAGANGPVDIVVHTDAGDSAVLAHGYRYAPTPVVTAVNVAGRAGPARGSTLGGTAIVVTGTDFDPAATVDLGGTAPAAVNVVTATLINLTTGPHCPPGPVAVTVRNPDGQTGRLDPGFEYIVVDPPPRVGALTPASGTVLGGTTVTVTGSGFQSGVRLTIGGVDAAVDIAATTATRISALVPATAGPPGPRDVRVLNPDCQDDTVLSGYVYI